MFIIFHVRNAKQEIASMCSFHEERKIQEELFNNARNEKSFKGNFLHTY